MQIKRGTWRTVLLIPALGIAIKFPRVYWGRAWRRIVKNHHKKGWWQKELFQIDMFNNAIPYVKSSLLRGMVENWKERSFYKKYKHAFCQPTFFSLLGLFNLQKYGLICQLDHYDFCNQFYDLPGGQAIRASHTWINPGNFCLHMGKLRILDYGEPKVQKEIQALGQLLQDRFDPNFSWEKYLQEQEARKNK